MLRRIKYQKVAGIYVIYATSDFVQYILTGLHCYWHISRVFPFHPKGKKLRYVISPIFFPSCVLAQYNRVMSRNKQRAPHFLPFKGKRALFFSSSFSHKGESATNVDGILTIGHLTVPILLEPIVNPP